MTRVISDYPDTANQQGVSATGPLGPPPLTLAEAPLESLNDQAFDGG